MKSRLRRYGKKISARFLRDPLMGLVGMAIVLGFSYLIALAAQYYSIGNGANATVNEWGTSKIVTNNCGATIFVPTNTSAEWSNFRSYKPACATLATPGPSWSCASCGGVQEGTSGSPYCYKRNFCEYPVGIIGTYFSCLQAQGGFDCSTN